MSLTRTAYERNSLPGTRQDLNSTESDLAKERRRRFTLAERMAASAQHCANMQASIDRLNGKVETDERLISDVNAQMQALAQALAAVNAGILDKATKAYVDDAITALVSMSPAALDTFNEIAQALGNDPSFASTMVTALSKRLRVDAPQVFSVAEMKRARSNLGLPERLEFYNGVTSATGLHSVNFTTPFASIPSVQPALIGTDTETQFRIISRTTTGFSIHVYKRAKLTVLGVDVLTYGTTNVSGAAVDVRVEGN